MKFCDAETWEELMQVAGMLDRHFQVREKLYYETIPLDSIERSEGFGWDLIRNEDFYEVYEPQNELSPFLDLSMVNSEVLEAVYDPIFEVLDELWPQNSNSYSNFEPFGLRSMFCGEERIEWEKAIQYHKPAIKEYFKDLYFEEKVIPIDLADKAFDLYTKGARSKWKELCFGKTNITSTLQSYLTANETFAALNYETNRYRVTEKIEKVRNYFEVETAAAHPKDFGDIRALVNAGSSERNFRRLMKGLDAFPRSHRDLKVNFEQRILPYVKSSLRSWKPHHRILKSSTGYGDFGDGLALGVEITNGEASCTLGYGDYPSTIEHVSFISDASTNWSYNRNIDWKTPYYPNVKYLHVKETLGQQEREWFEFHCPNIEEVTGDAEMYDINKVLNTLEDWCEKNGWGFKGKNSKRSSQLKR